MKALLIAVAGILIASAVQSAQAADLGPPLTKAPPMPATVPVYNWTGFYVGVNVGGGWVNNNYTNTLTGTFGGVPITSAFNSGSATAAGVIAGGQIGFNYEFPANVVVGVEADFDVTNITGSSSGCAVTAGGVVNSCASDSGSIQDFGTVRGRLGYAFNNVLVYGTGGWAYGESNLTSTTTCVGPGCPGASAPFSFNSSSTSASMSGWAAGGGIEWGFLPNWIVRAEYLHLQFDGVAANLGFTGNVNHVPVVSNVHNTSNLGIDVARAGVSYLFNWPR